jgi:SHS2 domain-containing protein
MLPHTADALVEAWGPDVASCLEELATGVIETCLDASSATPIGTHDVVLAAAPLDALALGLVDEVIFCIDAAQGAPAACEVRAADDGFAVRLTLADRATVAATGSVPKAAARSGLETGSGPDGVRCVVLIDV